MIRTEAQARRLVLRAYIGLSAASLPVWYLLAGRRYPGLLKERLRPGPGAAESVRQTLALYGLPWLGHYALAALDLGRFRWSRPLPLRLQVAGLLGYGASLGALLWAMAVNPFFSSAVRLQPERGHRVIEAGPYRRARHPGYAASIPLLLSSALALGSRWALPPALLWAAVITRRAVLEDGLLRGGLAGYAAYAERVRYRFLPGLW